MNLLDILLAVILGSSVIAGFGAGFARAGIGFFAAIVGMVFAFWFYGTPAAQIHKYVGSVMLSNILGYLVVFLFCVALGGLVGKLLSKLFKWTGLSWLDHILGAGFGFIRGMLVAVALVAILMAFTPSPPPNWMVGSAALPYVIDASNLCAAMAPNAVKEAFQETMFQIRQEWREQVERANRFEKEREKPREPRESRDKVKKQDR